MKRFGWILVLLMAASPAWAAKKISVQQLRDLLTSLQQAKKTDVEVATALEQVELSEQLTHGTMNSLVNYIPGPHATEQFYVLEVRSAALAPPAAELPSVAAPDAATRGGQHLRARGLVGDRRRGGRGDHSAYFDRRRGEQVVDDIDPAVRRPMTPGQRSGDIGQLDGHIHPVDQPEDRERAANLAITDAAEHFGPDWRDAQDRVGAPGGSEELERRSVATQDVDEDRAIDQDRHPCRTHPATAQRVRPVFGHGTRPRIPGR